MSRKSLSGQLDHNNKSIRFKLDMYIFKEGKSFIVYSPALDMSAYGNTESDAMKAFIDVFEISFKYELNKNTLKEDLIKHGWSIKSLNQRKIKAPTIEEMIKNNKSLRDILSRGEYRKYQQDVAIPELA